MQQIIQRINQAKHIVLIAHINPDADSLGSVRAFYTYLMQLQKKVSIFCYTKQIDTRLRFLPWIDKLKEKIPPSGDLFISFDCASVKRLGVDIDVDINFDHHKSNSFFATINHVDTDAISTTQVLYNYFVSQDVKINKKMATALYAGLVDDSDNFMSDKSDYKTFEMAKVLLQKDADKKSVIKELFQTSALSRLRLKGTMFSKMELVGDATIALHKVTQDDLLSSGAFCGDCEEALEESVYLPTVHIALLLCEREVGVIKGSIRTDASVDASEIAAAYGGGGHSVRAGFVCEDTTLDKLSKKLIKDILEKKK